MQLLVYFAIAIISDYCERKITVITVNVRLPVFTVAQTI